MEVIKDTRLVNKQYIKSILEYMYRGQTFKFSDRLLTIMVDDYQKKANNLKWLFGNQARIELKPTAEQVAKMLRQKSSIIKMIDLLRKYGVTLTDEQLTNSRCTYNKQEVRLNKIFDMLKPNVEITNEAIEAGNLVIAVDKKYFNSKQVISIHDIRFVDLEQTLYNEDNWPTSLTPRCVVSNYVVFSDGRTEHYIPLTMVTAEDRDYRILHKRIEEALYDIKAVSTNSVFLSIDPIDFISCSMGSFRSCFSPDSIHHLGWMNYWRADFGIIAFTASSSDVMSKTGRRWILSRFTSNGLPFANPFIRFQKRYGAMSDAQDTVIYEFFYNKIKEAFGIKPSGISTTATNFRLGTVNAGSNRDIMDHNYQSNYVDTDGGNAFYLKASQKKALFGSFNNVNFSHLHVDEDYYTLASNSYGKPASSILFDFPDALHLDGRPTHVDRWAVQTHEGRAELRAEPVELTCAITGNAILSNNATQLPDGRWVSISYLHSLVDGVTSVEFSSEPTITPEEAPSVATKVEISDEEMLDF